MKDRKVVNTMLPLLSVCQLVERDHLSGHLQSLAFVMAFIPSALSERIVRLSRERNVFAFLVRWRERRDARRSLKLQSGKKLTDEYLAL